jgi:hypothetical protein
MGSTVNIPGKALSLFVLQKSNLAHFGAFLTGFGFFKKAKNVQSDQKMYKRELIFSNQ